jgi:hypothetical protein
MKFHIFFVVKIPQNLVQKPERTRPLGRHRRRWEGDIKINLGSG